MIESYERLARSLNADAKSLAAGEEVLRQIETAEIAANMAEEKSLWAAIALFIAAHRDTMELPCPIRRKTKSESEESQVKLVRGNGIKLTALLNAAKISIIDFFEYIKLLPDEHFGTPDLTLTMKSLKEQYVITNAVYSKFQKLWAQRLAVLTKAGGSHMADPPGDSDLPNFAWMLYVIARQHLVPNKQMDMVTSYYVLLAVEELVLKHAYCVAGSGEKLLEALAFVTGVSADLIKQQRDGIQDLCRDLLEGKHLVLQGGSPEDDSRDESQTDSLEAPPDTPLVHMFHPAVLKLNILNLNNYYGGLCLDIGMLDERYVLNQELSHVLDTPSKVVTQSKRRAPPKGASRQLFADYNQHRVPSTPTRPRSQAARAALEMTPMSTMKINFEWIDNLDSLAREAGPALMAAVAAEEGDLKQQMEQRIESIFNAMLKSPFAVSLQIHSQNARKSLTAGATDEGAPAAGKAEENAETGFGLGRGFAIEKGRITALYYAVLEEIIQSESRRLGSSNHATLLRKDTFHRSILACCCEVILKPGSVVAFTYPDLLDYFDLKSFDLQVSIEPFVRAAPDLPSGLKRHMNELHELILLQDAWKHESPIFALLEEQQASGNWPIDRLLEHSRRPPQPPQPAEKAKDGEETRKKAVVGGGSREKTLEFFFRRLLAAAAQRLYSVTHELSLDHFVVDQIWTLLKYCLFEHHHLFKDRHADTLMLCSVYAISKINATPASNAADSSEEKQLPSSKALTFREIMDAYKKAGLGAHWVSVVKHITMGVGQGKTKGNVIDFYNDVFIRSVRGYVLQFQSMVEQAQAADKIRTVEDAKATAAAITLSKAGGSRMPMSPPSVRRRIPSNHGSPSVVARGAKMPPLATSSPSRAALPHPSAHRSPQRVAHTNMYLAAPGELSGTAMTPRTHALYAYGESPAKRALYEFGESPSKDLQLINRAVNKNKNKRGPPSLSEVTSNSEASEEEQRRSKRARMKGRFSVLSGGK